MWPDVTSHGHPQAPPHDVQTAMEVHETGGYRLLPLAIEEVRPAPTPPAAARAAAMRLMDRLLRTHLLQVPLPATAPPAGHYAPHASRPLIMRYTVVVPSLLRVSSVAG